MRDWVKLQEFVISSKLHEKGENLFIKALRGSKLVQGKSYQEVEGSFWTVVSGNWEPSRGEGFQVGVSGNRESSRSKKKSTSGRRLEVLGCAIRGDVEAH